MSFETPTRVAGGGYLDLRELVADGPVLVLFRIVEFLAPVADNFKRNTYPVHADALICSGPREGEVVLHGGEGFKFAPANALRGLSPEDSAKGKPVPHKVGGQYPFIVQNVTRSGNTFVVLDPADGKALRKITDVYEVAGGDGWWNTDGVPAASTPAEPAAEPAEEKVPATVGGGAPDDDVEPWNR